MKKLTFLRNTALAVAVILLIAGCGKSGTNSIRFGTAGLGGNYHTFGQTLASILTADDDSLSVNVKVTAGSAANVRLLSENYIQLAISQTDILSSAWNGTDAFEGKVTRGYGAVAGLYTEACQFVTLADSGITSIRDLKGKTVSIGEEESGSALNAEEILLAYGLNNKLVKEVSLNYTDAAGALLNGEIDAFFCTAGVRTTIVEELAKQKPISLLPVDGAEAQSLMEMYDFFGAYTIPAGTYNGLAEDVQTIGVKAVLLAQEGLSEEQVGTITEALFAHADKLSLAIPIDFSMTVERATEGIPVPFHKGAAAYYASCGITVPTE